MKKRSVDRIKETTVKGLNTVLNSKIESKGETFYRKKGKYLAKEGNKYIAIDNGTGHAWTEEFKSKRKARKWLNNG